MPNQFKADFIEFLLNCFTRKDFEDRGERRSLHAWADPPMAWTQGGAGAEVPAEPEQEAPGLPHLPR